MAFHAYTTNATDLIDYATYLYDSYGMDVWITEFADQVAGHLSEHLACRLTCSAGLQRYRCPSNHG